MDIRSTDYPAEMTMRLAVALASLSNAPTNAIIRSTKAIWSGSHNQHDDNRDLWQIMDFFSIQSGSNLLSLSSSKSESKAKYNFHKPTIDWKRHLLYLAWPHEAETVKLNDFGRTLLENIEIIWVSFERFFKWIYSYLYSVH